MLTRLGEDQCLMLVEHSADRAAAEALGCTQLQGFHLGRPVAAGRAGALPAAL